MFATHMLNEAGLTQVKEFKTQLSMAISKAAELLPQGRDKSIFITKIEEAVFFGTRAIASSASMYSEIIDYPEASHTAEAQVQA